MQHIQQTIASQNWEAVTVAMHQNGYVIVPQLLSHSQCDELKAGYNVPDAYRKTVVMERYRFGLGEYKYFNYPLPAIIQTIRESVYPRLVPIANAWMKVLNIETRFPDRFEELQTLCHDNN